MGITDYQGPTTLYLGPLDEQALKLAAAITAGYSKAPGGEQASVFIAGGGSQYTLKELPMERTAIMKYFVHHL